MVRRLNSFYDESLSQGQVSSPPPSFSLYEEVREFGVALVSSSSFPVAVLITDRSPFLRPEHLALTSSACSPGSAMWYFPGFFHHSPFQLRCPTTHGLDLCCESWPGSRVVLFSCLLPRTRLLWFGPSLRLRGRRSLEDQWPLRSLFFSPVLFFAAHR